MSEERFSDWVAALGPRSAPVLRSLPFQAYDPWKGLPRKHVKGTHPRRARLYRVIRSSLSAVVGGLENVLGWLDYHADVTFWPKTEWSDHSEVDWDRVSPEEKKKRTTFTFGFHIPVNPDDE